MQHESVEAFRNNAMEQTITYLAALFPEFTGLARSGSLRFDVMQTQRLRSELAAIFAKFIDDTPVEPCREVAPVEPSMEVRQTHVDAERDRLQKAGLRRLSAA